MTETARARDIMIKDAITVAHDMDVWELARFLTTNGITGAPVIDDNEELIGVVSQTDIIRHLERVATNAVDFYEQAEPDRPESAKRSLTARDLMTPSVIQATEDATVSELRQIMLSHHIHRIIITRGRKFVGVVTTMDILKQF